MAGATCAAVMPSMPSHMTGATTGAASRLAGSEASDTCSKWNARSGAVATVAATVIAVASATGSGRPRRASSARSGGASSSSPATAANESCQPGSPAARGFSTSVTAAASPSAYQRDAGRPASAATRPAIPITPARWIDGPPPASGTYSATRTAAAISRARSGTSSDRAGREHQHAEEQHVLAGDGEQVREAGPPEVGLDVLGDRLVLPEHHPAQQRGLGRREPAAQAVGRPLADGVEPAREAAARAPGRRPARDVDRHVGAAPPLVGVDVAERRHRPAQPQLAADAHAVRPPPVRGPGDGDLAAEPAGDRRGAAGVAPHAHVAHAGARVRRRCRRDAAGAARGGSRARRSRGP